MKIKFVTGLQPQNVTSLTKNFVVFPILMYEKNKIITNKKLNKNLNL